MKFKKWNGKPICKCCDSDEFVIKRSGGGFRCERCKTIFDEFQRVLGEQNYMPVGTFKPKAYHQNLQVKLA